MTQSNHSIITAWWGDAAPDRIAMDLRSRFPDPDTSLTFLQASPTRDDPMVRSILLATQRHGLRSHIAAPRSARAGLGGDTRSWPRLQMAQRTSRIDERMLRGTRVGVVAITADRRRGPFALDLASHFLHPFDRAKLLVARHRPQLAADIAASTLPDSWLIATMVNQHQVWLTTTDIIVAELWSLALAERFLDSALEMQGPWEDPTVQRATELELGARIPSEIWLRPVRPDAMPAEVSAVIASGRRRLGMRLPTGSP